MSENRVNGEDSTNGPTDEGFWTRLQGTWDRASTATGMYFGETFGGFWDEQFKKWQIFMEIWDGTVDVEPQIDALASGVPKGLGSTGQQWNTLHKELQEELTEAENLGGLMGFIMTASIRFGILTSGIGAYMAAVGALKAQSVNEDLKPSVVPLDVLMTAEMKWPYEGFGIPEVMAKWGVPEDQLEMYRVALRRFPGFTELLVLLNRGEIEPEEYEDYMRRQGFTDEENKKMMELRFFYPGASDLVTLAGREAFEEDQITKFGLDKDFEKIPKWIMEKAGVSDEVARWYWIAHWNNPSLSQFFEMVHRKAEREPGVPWKLEDADDYARLADINPTFVSGLRDIAYRPLTRVDVRRMKADGVLEREGVEKSYTDLGYSPVAPPGGLSDVELMTEWTIKYAERAERELTKTQILNMYDLHQIKPAEVVTYLELIGYETSQARQIRDLADNRREEKRLRSYIRRGEYEFKRGLETPDVVRNFLLDESIEALPSKEDVLGWYPTRIDEMELREHLRALRYTDANIDLYVQSEGEARLSKTDILRLLDQREIMEEKALTDLKALGYTPEDSMALIGPVIKRIARREKRESDERDDGAAAKAVSTRATPKAQSAA